MKVLVCWLTMLLCVVGEFASDLLIRARGLDHVNGINASAYDLVFSLVLGISFVKLLMLLSEEEK